jgi:hypothetical protein
MSGATHPLPHTTTRRQQELTLHKITMLPQHCASNTARAVMAVVLARACPLPPMIDGRVMNLIKAIRQRWQHVIAHGNKMVGIRDDLSV